MRPNSKQGTGADGSARQGTVRWFTVATQHLHMAIAKTDRFSDPIDKDVSRAFGFGILFPWPSATRPWGV